MVPLCRSGCCSSAWQQRRPKRGAHDDASDTAYDKPQHVSRIDRLLGRIDLGEVKRQRLREEKRQLKVCTPLECLWSVLTGDTLSCHAAIPMALGHHALTFSPLLVRVLL